MFIISPANLLVNFRKEMKNYGVKNIKNYHLYSYQKFLNSFDEKQIDCRNDLLIIDEAHNLRNMNVSSNLKGLRAKAVLKCAQFSSKRVLLTATPFINGIDDFIALINILYGGIIIKSSKEIKDINNLKKYLKGRIDYIKPKKIDKNYPQYKEHEVRIAMPLDYQKKYCKLIRGYEVDDTVFQNPQSFYNANRRAVNSLGESSQYFSLKIEEALHIIKDYKSVIYSNWLDFGVKEIQKVLKNRGISHQIYYGGITEKRKIKIVDDFNDDKFQVLVISSAGKEGLDLKGVRKLIVLDPVWNWSGMKQIEGRVIRFGSHDHLPRSERKVGIYYMILQTNDPKCKSGDTVLYKIIERKKEEGKIIDKLLEDVSISKI